MKDIVDALRKLGVDVHPWEHKTRVVNVPQLGAYYHETGQVVVKMTVVVDNGEMYGVAQKVNIVEQIPFVLADMYRMIYSKMLGLPA